MHVVQNGQNTAAPCMSYYICFKTWLMDNKDDEDKIGMLIILPTRGTGDSGQPPCSGRRRAMWPRYNSSSYLSNAVYLDLCGAEAASASLPCSTILSVVSCS